MPAGLIAGTHSALIDRWVLFAPIGRRGLSFCEARKAGLR
jgi:hypothetical protein